MAGGDVTKVSKGSTVKVKVNQVNSNGTGPYTCDLDETSNASGTSGQVALDVTDGSADSSGAMTLQVALPKDMACTGCKSPPDSMSSRATIHRLTRPQLPKETSAQSAVATHKTTAAALPCSRQTRQAYRPTTPPPTSRRPKPLKASWRRFRRTRTI